MFCAKCGKELPEDAAFCPGCGTQQGSQLVSQSMTQTAKSVKNIKPILLGCVALIVVLAVVLLVFGGNNVHKSPETVTVAFFESILDSDVEKIIDCMADPIINYLARSMDLPDTMPKSDVIDYIQQQMELQGDELFDQLSYREIDSLVINSYLGVDDLSRYGASETEMRKITNAAQVDVKIRKENGGRKTIHIDCVEINGAWFIWEIY